MKIYLFWWQLPAILIFIVGWVWGGGVLLRKSVVKNHPEMTRKTTLNKCILSSLLSGLGAFFAFGVVAYMFYAIASFKGGMFTSSSIIIPAFAIGCILMVAVGFMILYSMFQLSFAQTIRLVAPMAFLVLGLGIVLGTATAVPTVVAGNRTLDQTACIMNMRQILSSATQYERQFGSPAPDIKSLLDTQSLKPEFAVCPSAKDQPVGYFLYPLLTPGEKDKPSADQLRACDFRSNHGGRGRVVLMLNGDINWEDESEFQTLLNKPVNAGFAKALQAVDH
jgi:MFS family permease